MNSTNQSILVAVDFPSTLAELGPVFPIARSTGWTVHLVHAAAPEPAFLGYDDPGGVYDQRRRTTELNDEARLLEAHAKVFQDEGIEAHAHVLVGPTVEVLLEHAKQWNAALITVVGRHHNVIHRALLGSVAASLLKASPLPVLVLPSPEEDAEPGYTAAVDRLLQVIDEDERSPELAELRAAAASQLEKPDSTEGQEVLGGRLRDAWHQFETDHPRLIRAINDVGYYLSGSGV